MTAQTSGPWVTTAVLCENVVEDKEGVLTLVRIVDRVIVSAQAIGAAEPAAAMPPTSVSLNLVVTLKAGAAQGRAHVEIAMEGHDMVTRSLMNADPVFESPDRGQNLIMRLEMQLNLEGLYWFNVIVEGRLATRTPLREGHSVLPGLKIEH